MIPTLSQVCSLPSPHGTDLEDYAAGHCGSVEVWLTKLEEQLKVESVAAVQGRWEQLSLRVAAASYQGGLLTSQGTAREAAWELFDRRLALCAQLSIPTLVLACDVPAPLQAADVERARQSLRLAADAAERQRVRLALEFQSRSALGNNLQTAVALVEEVASAWLGICLDWFHFNIGPSKPSDLAMLHAGNLFHVQVADLASTPREFATDSDRILPGDGDFDFAPLWELLRTIHYEGAVALELLNPQIWQVPPRQFGEIAMTALRRQMGLASMD